MTARMNRFPLAVLATCALMTGSPLAQTFLKPLPATIGGPGGPCGCSREPLIADFNNDGLPDILMWDDLGGSLRCRLGLGGGLFGADVVSSVTPTFSWSWYANLHRRVEDLDGDGNLDVVATGNNGIFTFLGVGTGAFTETLPVPGSVGVSIIDLDVHDLEGDGTLELVYPGPPSGGTTPPASVTVARSMGGTFVNLLTVTMPLPVVVLRIGDFTGDGFRDILCYPDSWPANPQPLYVLVNDAQPGLSFTLAGPFPMAGGWLSLLFDIHVADVDRDGFDDVLGESPAGILTYRGHPTSVLLAPISFSLPYPTPYPMPWSTAIWRYPSLADFDGDGRLDLVWEGERVLTVSTYDCELRVWRGFGNGTFSSPLFMRLVGPFTVNTTLFMMDLGDVDLDSDPDVVVVTNDPGGISTQTFLNEAITGPGTPGSSGTPAFSIGPANSGNPSFAVQLSGAPPGALSALGLSLGTATLGTLPNVIWLDLSPGQLLWPSGPHGIYTTDANGQVTAPLPIPVMPPTALYAQWAVADPQGAFQLNGSTYSLSEARKIIVF